MGMRSLTTTIQFTINYPSFETPEWNYLGQSEYWPVFVVSLLVNCSV